MEFIIFLAFVIGIGYFIVKSNKSEKAAAGVVTEQSAPTGYPFPCVIEGSVDMSPMADRVKALAIEAQTKGLTITGDYVADYTAQGGEMTLCGNGFKFTIDATGQIVNGQSRLNLFAVDYPCEGGMNPDGSLGISVIVGAAKVGVKGRVIAGTFIDGEVRKGALPHIYGVLNGTYRKL